MPPFVSVQFSRSVVSNSLRPHELQHARPPCPSPTPRVHSNSCESESEVAQSCLTLCDPVDCSPPGSSVHGIFQARILEWVAISFSRGSSQPRDQTQVFRIVGRCFKLCVTREAILNLKFSFKGIHTHIPPKIWRHTLPHQCSFSVCTLKHGPEMGVFQSQLNQGKWLLYLSDLLS